MIRISDKQLIIEIPTGCPLETLSDIRSGIMSLMQNIVTDKSEVTDDILLNIASVSNLLKEMEFNYNQYFEIAIAAREDKRLNKALTE